jgi:hypothetical protein
LFEAPSITTDPEQLAEDCFDQMQSWYPTWEPDENALDVRMFRTLATVIGAPLATLLVAELERIFGRFGEVVFGLAPQVAVAATAETTWTAIDNAGYTIAAGTQVAIATAGDTTVGFRVLSEVSIPAGSTATAAGEVVIEAVIAGADGNGLDGDPELIDALTWVDSIVQTTAETSGGEDAETPDEYLDRLRETLTLLSDHAILPRDVEILAMQVPGVGRALALDTYNPADSTFDNEKYVAVAVTDEEGAALSSPVKDAVEALLALHREVNFVFNAMDPDEFNQVKVSTTVTALAGFDSAGIETAVEQAITDYLDSANWGVPDPNQDAPGGWVNRTTVHRNELIALVSNVEGVDVVTALTLALQAGVLGTADVALVGDAPLTQAGTVICTVA